MVFSSWSGSPGGRLFGVERSTKRRERARYRHGRPAVSGKEYSLHLDGNDPAVAQHDERRSNLDAQRSLRAAYRPDGAGEGRRNPVRRSTAEGRRNLRAADPPRRSYNVANAAYGGLKPAHPVLARRRRLGGWKIAERFSTIDVNGQLGMSTGIAGVRKIVGGAAAERKAAKSLAKKAKQAAAAQIEMLMPIAGKKPAKSQQWGRGGSQRSSAFTVSSRANLPQCTRFDESLRRAAVWTRRIRRNPGAGLIRGCRSLIVYDWWLHFFSMPDNYDPECQALAAMKLAMETNGTERQRLVRLALVWQELARIRAHCGFKRKVHKPPLGTSFNPFSDATTYDLRHTSGRRGLHRP